MTTSLVSQGYYPVPGSTYIYGRSLNLFFLCSHTQIPGDNGTDIPQPSLSDLFSFSLLFLIQFRAWRFGLVYFGLAKQDSMDWSGEGDANCWQCEICFLALDLSFSVAAGADGEQEREHQPGYCGWVLWQVAAAATCLDCQEQMLQAGDPSRDREPFVSQWSCRARRN